MKRCVILGAAPVENTDYIKLYEGDMIICADAGVRLAKKLDIEPDLVLGDFDSCDRSESEDFCTISFPKRKDDTDLMLAVKYGIESECDCFEIYGALGGRLDHTFAAFSTLSYLADLKIPARLVDERTTVSLLSAGENIIENQRKYISLFPFGCDSISVYLSGTEYDGEAFLTASFPLGVSNEIVSDSAIVSLPEGDGRVLAILSD
jgi:thiamine pyrophosphokinase